MADQYPMAVGGLMSFGSFFSGERQDYGVNLRLRPRRGVALRFEVERSVVDLAEGSFATNLLRASASTQLSPWLSLVNNLQYDNVSESLGWQLRFRWIQRPGNDLFLVYTHNWREFDGLEGRRLQTLDNRMATKIVVYAAVLMAGWWRAAADACAAIRVDRLAPSLTTANGLI